MMREARLSFFFAMSATLFCGCKTDEKSTTIQTTQDKHDTQSNAVTGAINETLANKDTQDQVEKELKKILEADPAMGDDKATPLTNDEKLAAEKAKDYGLVKNLDDVHAAAKEIGSYGQGLLGGQKVEFSDKEEFRCKATAANAEGHYVEILVTRPIFGNVALLRFSPNVTLAPNEKNRDFSVLKLEDTGKLRYKNREGTITFSISGSTSEEAGTPSVAHFEATIDGKDINEEMKCVKGPK